MPYVSIRLKSMNVTLWKKVDPSRSTYLSTYDSFQYIKMAVDLKVHFVSLSGVEIDIQMLQHQLETRFYSMIQRFWFSPWFKYLTVFLLENRKRLNIIEIMWYIIYCSSI